MRSAITKRGRRWSVVLDLGDQPCQVCVGCANGRGGKFVDRIFWVSGGERRQKCPECGSPFRGSQRRCRECHSGYDRRRDAEAAAIDLLSRKLRGEHVSPSLQTLGEYFQDDWIPVRRDRNNRGIALMYVEHVEEHGRRVIQAMTEELRKSPEHPGQSQS